MTKYATGIASFDQTSEEETVISFRFLNKNIKISDGKTPFQTVTSSTLKAGTGAVKEVKKYPDKLAVDNS